jgi:hypothetical protein
MERGFPFGAGSFLIIAAIVGVVLLWQQGWNPFPPKDYEECIESAAKSAKSKEALAILVSSCGSNFVGRRNPRGAYTYYDSRQSRTFDISGPNPTAGEWGAIERTYNQYQADTARKEEFERKRLAEQQRHQYEEYQRAINAQAEQEQKRQLAQAEQERKMQQVQADLQRRRQAALSRISVISHSIDCLYPSLPGCGNYKITATINNQSSETLSMLAVGWAFLSEGENNCPTYVQTREQEQLRLPPWCFYRRERRYQI